MAVTLTCCGTASGAMTPSSRRFAQADALVPGGVQGYDRYAYVNNNPVRYADPTGHKPCWATNRYSCSLTDVDINELRFRKWQTILRDLLEPIAC